MVSRVTLAGLLLLLTLTSGVWLTHVAKPQSVAAFTIHKLIALATVIFAGITVNQVRKGGEIRMPAVVGIVATGALILALIVTGALASPGRPAHAAVVTAHRSLPILLTISAAATSYLLASGRTS